MEFGIGMLIVIAILYAIVNKATSPTTTCQACGRTIKTSTDLPRMRRPEIGGGAQAVRMIRGLPLLLALTGCARDGSATSSKPLRVGHTFSNGNCALDSNNKLTGLCMSSNSAGTACTTHAPALDSPPCTPELIVKETRAPACSAGNAQEAVSREHQCYFVNDR